jgi:hypothetical protein
MMDFIEAFVEIYNVEASAILIFFCGLAILKLHKLNRDLLRARLFLNNAILEKTWMYISIGITFLALNALIKFVSRFSAIGDILNKYYMVELTQVIFLTAFSLAVYSCYLFINSTIKNSSAIIRKSNPT